MDAQAKAARKAARKAKEQAQRQADAASRWLAAHRPIPLVRVQVVEVMPSGLVTMPVRYATRRAEA